MTHASPGRIIDAASPGLLGTPRRVAARTRQERFSVVG
jgi:hypothetical protein